MLVTDEILAESQYYVDSTSGSFGCETGSVQSTGLTFNPLNPDFEYSHLKSFVNGVEQGSGNIIEAHYYTGSLGTAKLQLGFDHWVDLETGESYDPETGDSYTAETGYPMGIIIIDGFGEVGNSCKVYVHVEPQVTEQQEI